MIEFKILENTHQYFIELKSEKIKYPVDVYFITLDGKIQWNTSVTSNNQWVVGPNNMELDIRVIDSFGDVIFSYNYIFNDTSDIIERLFINWCRSFISKKGFKPKGFIIGAHNGSSGEWVHAYSQDLIGECLIIEPNINPFLSLTSKYKNDSKLTFKKCVISESNDSIDFYTDSSGESESSSLIESNYLKHENDGFQKIKVKSYNPNTLLGSNIPDFIHIDAEGYDGNIILILSDEILNKVKFIIWEHIHLTEDVKNLINTKLVSYGFIISIGERYNTCAYKNI